MKKQKILFIFIFIFSFCFIKNVKALSYEEELNKFPSSYQGKIKELHKIYPNAIFVAKYPDNYNSNYKCSSKTYNTKLNWNTMVNIEYYDTYRNIKGRSLTQGNDGYKSTDSWAYNYYTNKFTGFSGGYWYAANKQTVIYYLNSLNFINEQDIFMFSMLNYSDNNYTVTGIENILKNSFMYNTTCPGSNKKYSEVIIEAANQNGVNAYFLAARMKQEQGTTKGALVSGKYKGYENYYNYFNIQANGSTTAEVIKSGLNYAKSQGWDSEYKAIIGGAKFVGKGYIDDGQNTLYLQKWDATGTCWGNHQYMQNIQAPKSEASMMYNAYKTKNDYKNGNYIFYITVWKEQTTTTTLPNKGNPNNYLKEITVNGEKIKEFDGKNEIYTYNTSTSTNKVLLSANTVANTSTFYINNIKGSREVTLDSNNNLFEIKVVAANGSTKTYKLTINRNDSVPLTSGQIIGNAGYKTDGTYISGFNVGINANDAKNHLQKQSSLSNIKVTDINSNEKTSALATGDKIIVTSANKTDAYQVVIYGDSNGDGKISSLDYVKVKNYIMGSKSITGPYKEASDANRDGTIDARDYVKIKNSIMGISKISQ